MNLPNRLSVLRIILSFVFLFCLKSSQIWLSSFCATVIFSVCVVTDFLDGYLARKKSLITPLGSFIDPLADKILITVALIIFLERGYVQSWMVVLILTREFFVMGLRFLILSQKNLILPALFSGKLKTITQFLTLFFILFCHNQFLLQKSWIAPELLSFFIHFFMGLTVLVTLVSGGQYFWLYRDCFEEM